MSRLVLMLPALLILIVSASARADHSRRAAADEPPRERIEWLDIWVTDADKDARPRVLMIGDSITRAYFGAVEKRLEGKAYCARLATSTGAGDPALLDEVSLLLKQYPFDVIHFNNGLHGWGYTEEQYAQGMRDLLTIFRKQAPNARLVCATTTPVRVRGDLDRLDPRTERVRQRNRIVERIMREHDVPIDDLFALVVDHPEWQSSDGVHFGAEGAEAQAKQVAEWIEKRLP